MPTRRKPASPARIIECSPTSREVVWYKKPGRPLREAYSQAITRDITAFEEPRSGERTSVHTHNRYTGNIMDVLPSPLDVNAITGGFVRPSQEFQTMIISARKDRKVVGHTFVRVNYRQAVALFTRIRDTPKLRARFPQPHLYLEHMVKEYARRFKGYEKNHAKQNLRSVKEIEQFLQKNLALRLRFVPNKKEGYVFENGRYVKKTLKVQTTSV